MTKYEKPDKHLGWNILQKYLTALSRQLFLQKAPC